MKYLSETHDVDINVATFAYFKTEQGELLGRSMLLDETEVQSRGESKSKRKPSRSLEELRGLAELSGIVELYDKALSDLSPFFDGMNRTLTNIAFIGYMGENKARNVIISIYPGESTSSKGLALKFYFDRLCEYFSLSKEQITSLLGSQVREAQIYDPNSTWFLNTELLAALIDLLNAARRE